MVRGKVALVTGGGSGIGKAIGINLAKNGAFVAIAGRNLNRLESAVAEVSGSGGRAMAVPMDIRQRSEVERGVAAVAERWGAVHILVNNAGVSGMTLMSDPDETRWADIVDTNLTGTYRVTKAVLRHMPDHAGGRIINISSVLGKFGVAGYAAYCATKHGLIGFTRALALELVGRGITVNAICPGWVETEMAARGIADTAAYLGTTPEEFKKQAIAAVPIRRFLDAGEVAEIVVYVASDLARGITGQAINVCGGQTMI
ncbi:MAG TPA: SDR family NAD(P)-dependent oxidoreductase [candidate division Zixibacteria bacterium]|nr:SDR family NAD(P)-dependent oxidoreductase [candidate division Zixibacteria bacterium]